jgi:hypothetical protein
LPRGLTGPDRGDQRAGRTPRRGSQHRDHLVHVLEYVWVRRGHFEHADPDAEAWVAAQALKILQG